MRLSDQSSPQVRSGSSVTDKVLLGCGIVYAASYVVANDAVATASYSGYRRWDQAVSELSAKGADSRPFLVAMLPVWTALMIAFGVGIWRSAHDRRALEVTSGLMVAHGIVAIGWLWFPMTARADMVATGTGGNDAGHLVMSGLTGMFVVAELVSAAVAFGWWFRLYSIVTIVVILACGGLTSALSPNLQDGELTPWMGLYERISIGGWLLWMTVLAVILLTELRHEPSPGVHWLPSSGGSPRCV
jgi:hypothetical protein